MSASSKSASPLTVVHIGVVGRNIAGGMAQVVEEYTSWKYDSIEIEAIASTRGPRDWTSPLRLMLSLSRLSCVRVAGKPSVVVVHMSQGGSFIREGLVVASCRALGLPIIIQLHGSSFTAFAAKHPKMVGTVLNMADLVLVLTVEAENAVRERVHPEHTRVVRIVNAVGPPLSWVEKQKTIIFGGEVGFRKGVDVLLRAWELLGPKHPDWKVVIAGPIGSPASLLASLPAGVEYVGQLKRHDLKELESRASIAVLPSRHEAMPIFLLESMARRCAVVATKVGQIAEVIDGVGMLVEPGNVSQLQAALDSLLEDDHFRQDMGHAAYQRYVEEFSPDAVATVLEQEWNKVARKYYGQF